MGRRFLCRLSSSLRILCCSDDIRSRVTERTRLPYFVDLYDGQESATLISLFPETMYSTTCSDKYCSWNLRHGIRRSRFFSHQPGSGRVLAQLKSRSRESKGDDLREEKIQADESDNEFSLASWVQFVPSWGGCFWILRRILLNPGKVMSEALKVAMMSSISPSQCLASLREALGGLTLLRGYTQFAASFMAFSAVGLIPAFYVLTTTVLVIILIRIVLRRPPNLPPGPTGLPLIGSLHLLSALPHQNLAELAKKYGPLMSMRLGQTQCIIASSPETAMEFLKTQGANFSSRPPFRAGEVVLYGQDILCQNASSLWRHQRKIFQTVLTGPKRLEATQNVRAEEIAHLIRILPQNREIELRTYLSVMLNNIISRLVLNRRLSARLGEHEGEEQMLAMNNFKEITHELALCLGAFYPGDFIPSLKWLDLQGLEKRFKETNNRMDSFVSKIIAEHEAERNLGPIAEQEKDMVHILLDEMEKAEDKHQITMTNVKGMMWDAFSAAVDTILIACEWTMSELLRKPEVLAKAQAELDNVVGQHRRVQESDIPNLDYIQAIVKEGLRLHPPAPVLAPHQSIHACKAFGYDLPAKTRLVVNVWAIARDPSVWPNPTEFNPARFLQDGPNAGIDMQGRHFQLLPFGAGRRICPGMGLGLLTVQYCVASLLHAFECSNVTDDPDMAEGPGGLSVPRAVPLQVIARSRLLSDIYA